jgi:hypothetical protein
MAPSDRSDGNGKGRRAPAREEPEPPAPVERSSRGRIVVRSSSHPPGSERVSEAPAVEARSKRNTPAERPSRRKLQRADPSTSGGSRELSESGATPDLAAAVEPTRRSRARWIAPIGIAVLVTAVWLVRKWFAR